MLLLKKLIYGREFIYLFGLDCTLAFFRHTDFIPNQLIFTGKESSDMSNTLFQLQKDGLIEPVRGGYTITLASKRKVASGGYLRQALWARIVRASVVVGIAVSLLAIFL